MPRRPLLAFLAALVLAGCGQTDVSPTPSTEATPEVTATPAPTGPIELSSNADPLPPGTYTRSSFTPPITLELDGTWHAVQLLPGFFDVQDDPGSPDVIAVQFARPSAVYGADAAATPITTAEAAVAALTANPRLTVLETSDSRIGGLEGKQITVENPSDAAANVSIVRVPPGPLGIDPGRRLWLAFFDVPDGVLAIMVGGSVAKWDEALAAAEPVLESVTIGD